MTADLPRLLQQAVPEPAHTLDAATVLTAARRRQRIRTTLLAAVAAVVVLIAIGMPLVTRPTDSDTASVPLRLSVFDRRVPLGPVAAGALGDTTLVHPGEGGLATTIESYQVFLVEAAGERVCIVVVRENYGSAATGCHPLANLLTVGVIMYTNLTFGASGPGLLLVAAPDGYTRATLGPQRASIDNNLAVVRHVPGERDLEIAGPDVPIVTLDLDHFVPPGR
jgi:hypothetical protein